MIVDLLKCNQVGEMDTQTDKIDNAYFHFFYKPRAPHNFLATHVSDNPIKLTLTSPSTIFGVNYFYAKTDNDDAH